MKSVADNSEKGKKGACSSLTLPQTSQSTVIEEYGTRVWGCEDTFVANLFMEIGETDDAYQALIDDLEEHRQKALTAASTAYKVQYSRGGFTYLLRARGLSLGGATGVFMPYVLEGPGFILYLGSGRYPSGYNFNGRFSVGSTALMQANGIGRVYPVIRKALRGLGCRIFEDVVSRTDLAADVPVAISQFGRCYERGGLISRFKSMDPKHGPGLRWDGLQCGRGAIVLRVYDKIRELDEKKDDEKRRVMEERRVGWDGETLTRIEWQLRREKLKEWDCTSTEDWLRLRGSIVEYLMLEHTRLVDEVRDRTHTGRHTMPADCWLNALAAFREVCNSKTPPEPIQKVERTGAKVEALVRQALGCLASAVALEAIEHENDSFLTDAGIFERWSTLLAMAVGDRDIPGELKEKVAHHLVTKPSLSRFWCRDGDVI